MPIAHIAYAHHLRSKLPTAVDLQDANRNIELLIKYYQLSPKELAEGTLLQYSQPEYV